MVLGRDVLWSSVATVRSGRRTVRPFEAEAVEGLGRGDLVHEVEVDVEQVGGAVDTGGDDVAIPDLLAEGAGLRHEASFRSVPADSRGGDLRI